jgi:hypothetical protein
LRAYPESSFELRAYLDLHFHPPRTGGRLGDRQIRQHKKETGRRLRLAASLNGHTHYLPLDTPATREPIGATVGYCGKEDGQTRPDSAVILHMHKVIGFVFLLPERPELNPPKQMRHHWPDRSRSSDPRGPAFRAVCVSVYVCVCVCWQTALTICPKISTLGTRHAVLGRTHNYARTTYLFT